MIELIFATNNAHKVKEMQVAVGNQVKIITLKEAGIEIDIPEPHDTIEANASEKSRTIYELTGINCFGEDTGLEIEALNGEPGVNSARYAGIGKDFEMNIDKLLKNLGDTSNRAARFKTVISLILNNEETVFEGICEGTISYERHGKNGFGYDAVFVPTGTPQTFAELTLNQKNRYSHRKKACDKLVSFLQQVHIS